MELTHHINEATWRFVSEHAGGDIRQLALQASRYPDVDMPFALNQIAGREMARRKIPHWAATEGLIYPPHLPMEQCSGEETARYKASLVNGDTLVDLTGGLGVDFSLMARKFSRAIYVEQQADLCQIASHNIALLGIDNFSVVNSDAENFLHTIASADVIYLDPARRDVDGRRTYGMAECTPDVAQLAPELLRKAPMVMVKLSPMLDVSQVISSLPMVSDIHIVSTGGECKELLVIMRRDFNHAPTIHCVCDGHDYAYQWKSDAPPADVWDGTWHTGICLFEPNPSVMKAGCFAHVANRYGLQVVSQDSHLFVSDKSIHDFTGRVFSIDAVTTMNKNELRHALAGMDRANVAVRNFPLRATELAKRLRLKDGGDAYVFGTTTASGRHVILICSKK